MRISNRTSFVSCYQKYQGYFYSNPLFAIIRMSSSSKNKECTSNSDCLNGGVCRTEENLSKKCNCPTGFWGDRCDPICSLPCQNGGYCVLSDNDGGVHCQCLKGFGGELCDETVVVSAPPASSSSMTRANGTLAAANVAAIVAATSAVWLAFFTMVWVGCRYHRRTRLLNKLEKPQNDQEMRQYSDTDVEKDVEYSDFDASDVTQHGENHVIT